MESLLVFPEVSSLEAQFPRQFPCNVIGRTLDVIALAE